jgi:hypothetical protein
VERRGGDDLLVAEVLAGQGPRQRAAELIAETKLDDVAVRQALVDGGRTAVLASDDPLIGLALQMEEAYRELRKQQEQLDERERQAYATITEAVGAVEGTDNYPDATFTLRLAFGTVKGYEEQGERIEPTTDFAGAFAHAAAHEGQDDFELPESWYQAKEDLDLQTQLNFVCTADIIGGNSGSPVVNRAGELVGLIFDGNIQSLSSDYLYSDVQARAVSVDASGIREAIRIIYEAPQLAEALGR